MTPYYSDDWLTVYQGDCREVMRQMEPESVHCVVTSPPYWGLRDYGTAMWLGGDEEHDHLERQRRRNAEANPGSGSGAGGRTSLRDGAPPRECRCGATRVDSQLGLEATPEEFVANMVDVFRAVKRVLRSDGTCWVNLGDAFDSKQLQGMPWRVAFALQADGWYLRSDIIWSKPNPMPESVTDRPTKSHEYLFLLTKSARYAYDADAVREPHTAGNTQRQLSPDKKPQADGGARGSFYAIGGERYLNPADRNLRTVWTIATAPYPGAHFATFPPKLVEPCIKAGAPEKVCGECGAGWRRVTERGPSHYQQIKGDRKWQEMEAISHERGEIQNVQTRTVNGTVPSLRAATSVTTGWSPSCSCLSRLRGRASAAEDGAGEGNGAGAVLPDLREDEDGGLAASDLPAGLRPVAATVLDPFAGSGTVGMVAQSLSRRAVLIDLNGDYLVQAMSRNQQSPLGLETA